MLNRLLKLSISLIFYCFYKCIIFFLSILRKQPAGTLVVLEYHTVKPEQLDKFEKQMDILVKISNPVSADVKGPLVYGQNHVAVTFDDGFQSVVKNAIPAMRNRGVPVTLFIPTGYLGKSPGWIKENSNENRNEFLITSDQLKNLQDDLVTIGSHCVTHPRLSKLDKVEAIKELTESKKTLEGLLKKDITLLAFPFGDHNRQVLRWASEAGYKRVFSNIPTFPASKINTYKIGRISVSLEDWLIEYRLKLLGAYQWLPFAIALKWKVIKILGLD